ncbi:hypothetical protein JCM19235_2148 [Vibrio maritimus]|uniref:Uncharacterized protein n=2 Tax=Vibrio TaxID=662 RepID=A0A090RTG5_9VIBR|nr:hypothetical protein JCM19235_2148 [Vibrio maritimus]GAL26680.1 hypothetical protein JCM19239_182 [Vibrio variabilis]
MYVAWDLNLKPVDEKNEDNREQVRGAIHTQKMRDKLGFGH